MVERKWDKERMRKVMDESKKEFFDLTESSIFTIVR